MKIEAALAIAAALALTACPGKKNAAGPVSASASPAASPAAPAESAEPVWLVHDNGKRCIVAPCPSWTAVNVDSRQSVDVANVDLSAMKLSAEEEKETRAKITAGQAWARGQIYTVSKMGPGGDGQVLKVTGVLDATGKQTTAP